eukprot:Opistho-1_new@42813
MGGMRRFAASLRAPIVATTLADIARSARVDLGNLRPLPRRVAQRVGRGPGSHRGKHSGKPRKGMGKWNNRPGPAFESQTPFHRLLPKRGFRNIPHKLEFQVVNLGRLQQFIDQGRISPGAPITMHTLQRSGAVAGRIRHGVKLLADGAEFFRTPVDIVVSRASKAAIEAVERAGGKVTCKYYGLVGLRCLLKPEKFALPVRDAIPAKFKLRLYYSDPANRGYLDRVGPNKFVIRRTDVRAQEVPSAAQ